MKPKLRRNAFILDSSIQEEEKELSDVQSVEAVTVKANGLSQDIVNEVFDLFDSNGGGTIDAEELDLALRSVDIQLSQEEIVDVLTAMDKDGNGEIDFEEFLNLMTNTERFIEGFDHNDKNGSKNSRRETMLFEALTNFMKRSALHSLNEIVGFYHTKYKRIQAPHVVGHYAAGARLIGLTEGQLRKHMETLRRRHAEGDEKSPYAEPLHIVFGNASKKKRRPKKAVEPVCRGKIRLRFTSFSSPQENKSNLPPPSKATELPVPILQRRRTPQSQLRRSTDMKKPGASGWKSQRIKPFSVQLQLISGKTNAVKGNENGISIDYLPDIRNKVDKAKDHYFERVHDQKKKESQEHWEALKSGSIKSDALRNKFRIAFNAYTNYLHIDQFQIDTPTKNDRKRSKSVSDRRGSEVPSPFTRKRAYSTFQ
ncbi:Caltractin [Exaiptasia diaphana]|nr:Caltractin [Exaiptasia diaphana]